MLLRIPLMIVRHYKLDNTIASSDRQFLLKIIFDQSEQVNSHQRFTVKIGVLKTFAKITGKHLC